jgi:hypothetical protein
MGLYTDFFYSKEQDQAQTIINFYEDKIERIKTDDSMCGETKNIKIERIEFSIKCIKYTYGL